MGQFIYQRKHLLGISRNPWGYFARVMMVLSKQVGERVRLRVLGTLSYIFSRALKDLKCNWVAFTVNTIAILIVSLEAYIIL